MTAPEAGPALSVVLTIVAGGDLLEACLQALEGQSEPPEMEILVPWDDSLAGMAELAHAHPNARFVPLGRVATDRPIASAAGQHELYDRRRAAGLTAARGRYVAIIEDRAPPRADWARTMMALHQRHAAAAIGGAIDPAVATPTAWAIYFSDFGRYQNPVDAGPVDYLSDVNVCYRRASLEATRPLWTDRYHETSVHWALRRRGEILWLSPEPVVEQRLRADPLVASLRQRRDWGRLFAVTRVREVSPLRRAMLALGTPLLPPALFLRHARARYRKRRSIREFWRAAPAMAVLLAAWSWGELLGYLTGRP